MSSTRGIQLSLPSNGRLEGNVLEFLSAAGLRVFKPNPRQYQAELPALPDLGVIFQRTGDIVVSVRQGSVDFGITGLDVIEEKRGDNGDILILHDALGFGHCALTLAVPESWASVTDIHSLKEFASKLDHPLRVATKFPNLTKRFLNRYDIPHVLIAAEGTLETAPTIGYAERQSLAGTARRRDPTLAGGSDCESQRLTDAP
jgi:ATP phosphoribosyltransferase